jgi:hypothetical protein
MNNLIRITPLAQTLKRSTTTSLTHNHPTIITRCMSTYLATGIRYKLHHRQQPYKRNPLIVSTRSVSNSTISLLQSQEQHANNDLNNATAQLEFYKSLLANNYPHIVVQRYETPGIAASPECTQLYIEALNKIGKKGRADQVANALYQNSNNNNGAYAGAGASSGAPPLGGGSGFPHGFGSRYEPVHVVVSESLRIGCGDY